MHLAAATLVASALLGAAPAHAQFISRSSQNYRSPKNFALELRFGPYSPDIDAEFKNGMKPHEQYFGSNRRLMSQLEVDYQLFHGFGSAAVGLSVGFFRERAKAFFDPATQITDRSGDETQLTLLPVALLGVYRADQLWDRLGIPLVPYGKLGLNYTIWRILDGSEEVATAQPVKMSGTGKGGTWGWQAGVGLAFVLDVIDPGSARELDSETGVNHTYVFGEFTKYAVSGLGQSGKLNVGDNTWSLGLMFEF
jgi:hypothetical protein